MCLDCGYLLPPSPLETTAANTVVPDATRVPEADSTSLISKSTTESTPAAKPAIINHRASSHYRQRLAQRQHQLERPELQAPPKEPLLETTPNQLPALIAIPTPQIPIEAPVPEEASFREPTIKTTPPLVLPPLSSDDAQLLFESQAEVTSKPTERQAAIDKAEQLLATADSTPNKAAAHVPLRNWLMLGATVVLLLVSASVFANALHKAAPSTSSPPTTSSTPTIQVSGDSAKRDAQRKTDLNTVAIGLEAYKKSTGAYPVGSDISVLYPLQKTAPPYIADIPNDPLTTKDEQAATIRYGYSSDGTTFTITAVLESKQDSDSKDGLYTVKNTP